MQGVCSACLIYKKQKLHTLALITVGVLTTYFCYCSHNLGVTKLGTTIQPETATFIPPGVHLGRSLTAYKRVPVG